PNSKILEFTINVGITVRGIGSLMWGKENEIIKEEECLIRKRPKDFGLLTDIWTYSSQDNLEILIINLKMFLEQKIIRYLNDIKTIGDLDNEFNKLTDKKSLKYNYPDNWIRYACIKSINGETNASIEILEKISTDKVWGEKAIETLSRIKVISN
ncbi:MAG TPA: hypothetical protein V6C58_17555, partial [Allocoleopsis sp.]